MAKSSNSKTVDKKTKSSSHSSSTSSRKGSGIYVKAFVACFFIDGEDLTGPLPRKIKRIAGQIGELRESFSSAVLLRRDDFLLQSPFCMWSVLLLLLPSTDAVDSQPCSTSTASEPGSICAPGVRKFDKSADGKLIAFDLRDKNGKRVLKWIPYVVSEEEAECELASCETFDFEASPCFDSDILSLTSLLSQWIKLSIV